MTHIDTLEDIERGAEAFIKKYIRKEEVTPREWSAIGSFEDMAAYAFTEEWLLTVCAKMLTGDPRGAMDFLRQEIEDAQPETPSLLGTLGYELGLPRGDC